MKVRVHVTLKPGVLDVQGKAVEGALRSLGHDGVSQVRQGKLFTFEIDGSDRERVGREVDEICRRLLANTVIEDYAFDRDSDPSRENNGDTP